MVGETGQLCVKIINFITHHLMNVIKYQLYINYVNKAKLINGVINFSKFERCSCVV